MEKEYYEILGISFTATDEEIKKAYRQMILKYHSDRNQTAEAKKKLLEIEEAYAVLKDKSENASTSSSSNFYDTSKQQQREKVQDPAIIIDLYVSLEDIMNGRKKKIKISKCVQRDNETFKKEIKTLTINIKRGWKAGTKIIFHKEGDQEINKAPADIVFIIRDKPHPLFKREGNDIIHNISISLKEALCGAEIVVPTLTDKKITLDMKSEIISPTTIKRLQGYGLPYLKNPSQTGDMLITFDIQFPDFISPNVRDILYEQLPRSD